MGVMDEVDAKERRPGGERPVEGPSPPIKTTGKRAIDDTALRSMVREWVDSCVRDLGPRHGTYYPIQNLLDTYPHVEIPTTRAEEHRREYLREKAEEQERAANIAREDAEAARAETRRKAETATRLEAEKARLVEQMQALDAEVRRTNERFTAQVKTQEEKLLRLESEARERERAAMGRPVANPPAVQGDHYFTLLIQTKDDTIVALREEIRDLRQQRMALEQELRQAIIRQAPPPSQGGTAPGSFQSKVEQIMMAKALSAIESGGAGKAEEKNWFQYVVESGQLPEIAREVAGLIPLVANAAGGRDEPPPQARRGGGQMMRRRVPTEEGPPPGTFYPQPRHDVAARPPDAPRSNPGTPPQRRATARPPAPAVEEAPPDDAYEAPAPVTRVEHVGQTEVLVSSRLPDAMPAEPEPMVVDTEAVVMEPGSDVDAFVRNVDSLVAHAEANYPDLRGGVVRRAVETVLETSPGGNGNDTLDLIDLTLKGLSQIRKSFGLLRGLVENNQVPIVANAIRSSDKFAQFRGLFMSLGADGFVERLSRFRDFYPEEVGFMCSERGTRFWRAVEARINDDTARAARGEEVT